MGWGGWQGFYTSFREKLFKSADRLKVLWLNVTDSWKTESFQWISSQAQDRRTFTAWGSLVKRKALSIWWLCHKVIVLMIVLTLLLQAWPPSSLYSMDKSQRCKTSHWSQFVNYKCMSWCRAASYKWAPRSLYSHIQCANILSSIPLPILEYSSCSCFVSPPICLDLR